MRDSKSLAEKLEGERSARIQYTLMWLRTQAQLEVRLGNALEKGINKTQLGGVL